ncbi:MAG: IreB family regulatory phosphoprotein [Clostridia bacterium]
MDQNTTVFVPQKEESKRVKEIMDEVVLALKDKGYEPISQIIGYILSGDPTYITSHKDARALICKIERDDLLEEMIKKYLDV